MVKPEHRDIAIRDGHRMLEMAEAAKQSGQIKDYYVFVDADDPAIITDIQLVKNDVPY